MGRVIASASHDDLIKGHGVYHPQDISPTKPNISEPMNRTARMYEKIHPVETDEYHSVKDVEGESSSVFGDNLDRQLEQGAIDMPQFEPQYNADKMPTAEDGYGNNEVKQI